MSPPPLVTITSATLANEPEREHTVSGSPPASAAGALGGVSLTGARVEPGGSWLLPSSRSFAQIAIDIGGSLAKIVWFSRGVKGSPGRLSFKMFETEDMDGVLEFMRGVLDEGIDGIASSSRTVVATGGGSYKYFDLLSSKLGVEVERYDELETLITGFNFCVASNRILDEIFSYDELRQPNPINFIPVLEPITAESPVLIVNVGSGVSILKVSGEDTYERVSGTSIGGGTLWGLLSILSNASTYEEMLELSKKGDHHNVDLLVGDIYGTEYSKIGLKSTTIASSVGKVFKQPPGKRSYKPEDLCQSLLYMISNNLGQLAFLNAQLHGCKRIFFTGSFIRGHPPTMSAITFAVQYWSQGRMESLFLRHEGYLGALGAFVKHTPANRMRAGSFAENFTLAKEEAPSVPSIGTLDQLPIELTRFPLLSEPYVCDTFDMTPELTTAWIDLLQNSLHHLADLASEWAGHPENKSRAQEFEQMYLKHLRTLRENPSTYGALSLRSLLLLREECLRELGFYDLYDSIKADENSAALKALPAVLASVDAITDEGDRIETLIDQMNAGNMFDWGAVKILEMLRNGELDFASAKDRIKKRPKFYNIDKIRKRMLREPFYKKAVIIVDNSGADIVLGVLPFARYLVSRSCRVILGANSFPALNDVTAYELPNILDRASKIDSVIEEAWKSGMITVMGTGAGGPCIDLSRVDCDFARATADADLVVLEGMGRAIHTNHHAHFQVDSLKVAVLKVELAASSLGAEMYEATALFEEAGEAEAAAQAQAEEATEVATEVNGS